MRDGMKSFDQPLHVGLAVLLLGGVVALDYAHNTLWEARNKGVSGAATYCCSGRGLYSAWLQEQHLASARPAVVHCSLQD